MSAPLKHVPLAERDENDPEQRLGTVLDVILAERSARLCFGCGELWSPSIP